MHDNASDIKRGQVIKLDGEYFVVMDTQHITPGNWRGYVQMKIKNLRTEANVPRRFSATERVEIAHTEKKDCEYLYRDGPNHIFMDTDNYEQYSLADELVAEQMPYVAANGPATVLFIEGRAVGIDLPPSVVLTVKEADAGVKGDTATNVKKRAVVETGLEIKVPLFITVGEKVKIDTRTGAFLERSS